MRFKGKVSWWFYAMVIAVHAMLLPIVVRACMDANIAALLLTLLVLGAMDLICLPILLRNFVELQGESLVICFGLSKKVIPCREITALRATNNPIASLAASLDRIEIKCKGKSGALIALMDKESFFRQMQECNPDIAVL